MSSTKTACLVIHLLKSVGSLLYSMMTHIRLSFSSQTDTLMLLQSPVKHPGKIQNLLFCWESVELFPLPRQQIRPKIIHSLASWTGCGQCLSGCSPIIMNRMWPMSFWMFSNKSSVYYVVDSLDKLKVLIDKEKKQKQLTSLLH